MNEKTSKSAFTLAEVLITLGIIGVVAAITIPMFMENVNGRVKAKRMENIHQKLSKVTDKMASLDVLQGHASTHDFVYEMKKHMNIAKICENDNIAGCWPTSTVDLGNGKNFEISKATTAKNLKATINNGEEWDDTMGIVTGDGTSMIISYNKKCHYDANTMGLTFDKASGMSSTLTSGCLAIVYDWNGGSKPNKLSDDVIAIGKAGGLGNICVYKTKSGLCIAGATHVQAKALTATECEAQKSTLGIHYCLHNDDYWAAAVAECGHVDKMFSKAELDKMMGELYSNTFDSDKALALGLPNDTSFFYFWSGDEQGQNGATAVGRNYGSGWGGYAYRTGAGFVLCKGD